MLNAVRIAGMSVLLALNLLHGSFNPIVPVVTAVLFGIASRARGVASSAWIRSLLIAFGMAAFFALAALVSSALRGVVDTPGALRLFLSIAGVLLAVRLGIVWAGRPGGLSLLRAIPSQRIRIYLLVLSTTLARLMSGNALAVHALTARLGGVHRNGLTIARWYVQNLIARELYALHWYQAVMATRIPPGRRLPVPRMELDRSPADAVLVGAIVILSGCVMAGRMGAFP